MRAQRRILKDKLLLWCISVAAAIASGSAYSGVQSSVTYQVSPTHTGEAAPGMTVTFPLKRQWSVDLGEQASYPLIAEGKVFVNTSGGSSSYGSRLTALDAATGAKLWGPVELSGTYFWANIAYEAGRVYTVNFDGLMRTYSAADGHLLWSVQLPGQYSFSSPPTAIGGVVYVGGAGSGGTLYAVDGANGAVLWTQPVANGDDSSPAVADGGVFVSYACPQAYRFAAADGTPVWHYSGPCEGGGGSTPVYRNGKLYVRDASGTPSSGLVLDGATGQLVSGFNADTIPAISDNDGYFLSSGTLRSISLDSQVAAWSFAGDGKLDTPPILIDNYVFIGSGGGTLYALDRSSGAVVWQDNLGTGIPGYSSYGGLIPGFGVGDGLLVVPAGNKLFAYPVSEAAVAAPTVSLRSSASKSRVGGKVTLTWSSTNPDVCSASGDWSGSRPASGNEVVSIKHSGQSVYTLSCGGGGGTAAKTVTVQAGGSASPTLTLSASSERVVLNSSVTLAWGASNANTCTASGDWNGGRPIAGTVSLTVGHLGPNTFTLTCSGDGGNVAQSAVVTGVLPTVSFAQSAEETPKGDLLGRSSVAITVQLSRKSPVDVVVPLTVSGSESPRLYTVTPTGTVTIPAGAKSATVTVDVRATATLLCNRTVVLTLGTPDSATLGAITTNTLTVTRHGLVEACVNKP